ncbi:inorganic polyphosphate/ATP-NAD kinase PpnK [Peptoclostridium acidaminophilum DSM 3953]|uniref:NAD kinase n=1 Tax=Peptoclostridium acidaminophilum DSM 3953 TaxID=1286171 RepID=W8U5P3_PEPAC|nr:NAD(+)/NADH kinase [Peptoclostridium acidaminophilum]AHM56251.1 inorganic polyphosphate/ATP-NAD kinase PpnK [Peptoclostridium acidaminophilum DSM 3953]
MKRIIYISTNEQPYSLELLPKLKHALESYGFVVPDDFDARAELIICIGGDGSFLNTLHKYNFPKIPLVGINTGHLGFFQEIHPNEIEEFIHAYLRGDFFIQKARPIQAVVHTSENTSSILGLNEIVIKSGMSRTVHLNISVNGNFIEKFSGDGLIVSTPSGSTAYNYSAGGSIVDPSLNLIQVTPLAPINTTAYRSFTSSIVLPEASVIEIISEDTFENSLLLVSDGIEFKRTEINKISVTTSDMTVRFLRLRNYEFWSKVKEKFL